MLIFQRSTAFHLQSHTTCFHGTKQLNAAANIGFRTRLLRILPQTVFFPPVVLFLPDKTHLVYLIISAISVLAFENGLPLWVELIERIDMEQRSIAKMLGTGI